MGQPNFQDQCQVLFKQIRSVNFFRKKLHNFKNSLLKTPKFTVEFIISLKCDWKYHFRIMLLLRYGKIICFYLLSFNRIWTSFRLLFYVNSKPIKKKIFIDKNNSSSINKDEILSLSTCEFLNFITFVLAKSRIC